MRRPLSHLGIAGAATMCLAGIAMTVIGATSFTSATDARDSARSLYEARGAVAEAQDEIGGSDLDDAVRGARSANASAIEVRQITRRIAELLHTTRLDAEVIGRSSRRGARTVVSARRQTEAAARSLAAIRTYQHSSSASTIRTNRALARILRALRETNRSFPGGG